MTGKKILISIIAILTALAIVELTLRIFLHLPKLEEQSIPDQDLVAKGNPKFQDHDAAGFRNESGDDKYDVVAFGDSQTYGLGVESQETWPKVFQNLTGVKTYNMSFPGYGPVHYLQLFDEALAKNPKIIIASFYSGNDLYDAYSQIYRNQKHQEFQNKQSFSANKDPLILAELQKQEATEPFLKKIAAESTKRHQLIKSYFEYPAKYIKFYALIVNSLKNILKSPALSWILIKEDAELTGSKTFVLQTPTNGNETILTPAYRLLALNLEDQRIAEGLRITEETISQMAQESQKANVQFVVLFIPTKEFAYQKLALQLNPTQAYLKQTEAEKKVFSQLEEYLDKGNILTINSAAVLQEEAKNGKPIYQATADGHLTVEGHLEIAKLLASKLNLADLK